MTAVDESRDMNECFVTGTVLNDKAEASLFVPFFDLSLEAHVGSFGGIKPLINND